MLEVMLILTALVMVAVLYLAENRLNFVLFFGLVILFGAGLLWSGMASELAVLVAERLAPSAQVGVLFYLGISLAGLAVLAANLLPRRRRSDDYGDGSPA
jgi:hypothetical protein